MGRSKPTFGYIPVGLGRSDKVMTDNGIHPPTDELNFDNNRLYYQQSILQYSFWPASVTQPVSPELKELFNFDPPNGICGFSCDPAAWGQAIWRRAKKANRYFEAVYSCRATNSRAFTARIASSLNKLKLMAI